jgi:hypothetical protein
VWLDEYLIIESGTGEEDVQTLDVNEVEVEGLVG